LCKNMYDLYHVTTEFVVPIRISLIEGCYHDLVDRYGISVSKITTDIFHLS
jgi:hypothetical protein